MVCLFLIAVSPFQISGLDPVKTDELSGSAYQIFSGFSDGSDLFTNAIDPSSLYFREDFQKFFLPLEVHNAMCSFSATELKTSLYLNRIDIINTIPLKLRI